MNSRDYKAPQVVVLENHPADSRMKICDDGVFQTLSSRMGTGGNNVPMVMESYQEKTGALCASGYDKLGVQEAANDMYVVQGQAWDGSQVSSTLTANNANGAQRMPDKENFNAVIVKAVDCRNNVENDVNGTLQAKSTGGIGVNFNNTCRINKVVRRLTPLECTRLQNYPDGWVDIGDWTDSKGKLHKDADSPKYKALGNSIALPFWQWMADRMVKQLKKDGVKNPTMASLFSGIGGFELVYTRAGCKPIWNSEIEEFCIAVTKKHFGDEEQGIEGDIGQYIGKEN